MSTHIKRLCGCLNLPHADAWAAHATVEHWLRTESQPESETNIDRIIVGSRLLSRLETGDRMTRDQLSLLGSLCRERLDTNTVPARDRGSLVAVVDHVEYSLEMCSA